MEGLKVRKRHQNLWLRILSGVGYFMVFIEWFGLVAMYLPSFVRSPLGKLLFPTSDGRRRHIMFNFSIHIDTTVLVVTVAVVIGAGLLLLVLYLVLFRQIPDATKATGRVTRYAAAKTVSAIAHKPIEKISGRKQLSVTTRVLFWINAVFTLVPLGVIVLTRLHDDSVVSQLLVVAFAMLCGLSLVCFSAYAALSNRWRIPVLCKSEQCS